VLIEQALVPEGSVGAALRQHIDSCLGCMACMSVCPEDVDYPSLLRAAREAIDDHGDRPLRERIARRAALATVARAGRAARIAGRSAVPHFTAAQGEARGRVGLLLGCSHRAATSVHQATLEVLAAEGYEVIAPRLPDCCGSHHLQSGASRIAARHAQATIDAFAAVGGVDHVLTDSGRCGVALKDYGRLLGTAEARAFSSLALDVHELLTPESRRSPLAPLALRVALHNACQLQHAQRLHDRGRMLLAQIPRIELIDLDPQAGACCGAPGIYRLTEASASAELGDRQARAIAATGADVLVTGDSTCGEQLAARLLRVGYALDVRHPIELVARSMAAAREA
jgi:glycolate oxidase iron-sulfur subunit